MDRGWGIDRGWHADSSISARLAIAATYLDPRKSTFIKNIFLSSVMTAWHCKKTGGDRYQIMERPIHSNRRESGRAKLMEMVIAMVSRLWMSSSLSTQRESALKQRLA